jgi:hypothetical protein
LHCEYKGLATAHLLTPHGTSSENSHAPEAHPTKEAGAKTPRAESPKAVEQGRVIVIATQPNIQTLGRDGLGHGSYKKIKVSPHQPEIRGKYIYIYFYFSLLLFYFLNIFLIYNFNFYFLPSYYHLPPFYFLS